MIETPTTLSPSEPQQESNLPEAPIIPLSELIPVVALHPDDALPSVPKIPLKGLRYLERIVSLVRDKGASDVHLLEGERPRIRIHGNLMPVESKDHPLVTRSDIEDILNYALTPKQRQTFDETADVDFSLDFLEASGRVNVGLANGSRFYLTMRYLRANLIPLDQIGINPVMLKKLATNESGLIIVTGETSSGKTTTIAAMLDYINHNRMGSITTIENPVEYILHSDKCLITRREIGRDTPNFHDALRATVRKNPDVLLIGEIRDVETAAITLNAAETGIQTFCTLHAVGAIQSIIRLGYIIISGGQDESQFHQRLSNILTGIISQQLISSVDGSGSLPVYEILNVTYSEKNYIRTRDYPRLEQSLETDRSISLGKCIYHLWHQEPRRINEGTVHKLFGDQFNLMMNRLADHDGWKPLSGSMG